MHYCPVDKSVFDSLLWNNMAKINFNELYLIQFVYLTMFASWHIRVSFGRQVQETLCHTKSTWHELEILVMQIEIWLEMQNVKQTIDKSKYFTEIFTELFAFCVIDINVNWSYRKTSNISRTIKLLIIQM